MWPFPVHTQNVNKLYENAYKMNVGTVLSQPMIAKSVSRLIPDKNQRTQEAMEKQKRTKPKSSQISGKSWRDFRFPVTSHEIGV
jgi:hypothetical protein